MDKSIYDFLNTDLQYIKGVGPVLAARLGVLFGGDITPPGARESAATPPLGGNGRRVLDFLLNPPRAVRARNATDSVVNAAAGEDITIALRIDAYNAGGARYSRYGKKFTAPAQIVCRDKFGAEVKLQFFNTKFFDYWKEKMPIGEWRMVSGKLEFSDRGGAVINHPDFIEKMEDAGKIPAVQPIYPLSEGLTQKTMANIRDRIFEKFGVPLPWRGVTPEGRRDGVVDGMGQDSDGSNSNYIFNTNDFLNHPVNFVCEKAQQNCHPSKGGERPNNEFLDNLRAAHYPTCAGDTESTSPARQRLAYCELFAQQCAIALTRKKRETLDVKRETIERSNADSRLTPYVSRLYQLLPFSLTDAQTRVVEEILIDMKRDQPMMRLVQGDVGSGKTIVALIAMLSCAESGAQAALLAPTDTLAKQHYEKVKPLCDELGIVCDIFTGRDKGKARHEKLISLKSGRTKIIIGTHALFQNDVEYKDLGIAVIDEQHRFGVAQRAAFAAKGRFVDLLALSATPIPRTLSMTMYGDMDISVIDKKPAGRMPIKTTILPVARVGALVQRINAQLAESTHQNPVKVFWVCPLVEESETSDMMAAEARYEFLKKHIVGGTVGLVHGKMPKPERDKIMAEFADPNSNMRVLVSTTVIEVGIDVPHATIMVIENAERFGLSALHQLRGRVGRGSAQSFCILMYGDNITEDGQKR
ncbi:MAG: ATP-dependent DNA helicase RecG, partial [Proteobacteria bacterium]|nr:ATP-dependent DNA helicase RecG [Pseudomonadota bacterium]